MKSSFSILILAILIASCSSNPYSKTNRIHRKQLKRYAKELREFPGKQEMESSGLKYGPYEVGTTNFNMRKPNFVVIHHTAQDSVQQTLRTFTLPRTQVSSHYVIADNGQIYKMLNDYFRGWHAGTGSWGNTTDLNSASIGIELDNNGYEEFSEAQIESLIKLLKELKENYGIPQANFIGHSDIAPSRKVDPNANFPWKRLAEEGFGHWYDEDQLKNLQLSKDSIQTKSRDSIQTQISSDSITTKIKWIQIPENFDPLMALRIIGYDISNPESAIKAFKLHFIQENIDAQLTDEELKILFLLYRKYL